MLGTGGKRGSGDREKPILSGRKRGSWGKVSIAVERILVAKMRKLVVGV